MIQNSLFEKYVKRVVRLGLKRMDDYFFTFNVRYL